MNSPELDRQEKLTNRLALDLFLEAAHDEWDRGEMDSDDLSKAKVLVEQISYKLSLGDNFDTMMDSNESSGTFNGVERVEAYQ